MATNSSQPYNLEQALKRGGSTCQPLRVRVLHERLATSDAVKRVFIIGDSSSAGECVVYDKLASGRFHVGSSVVILNASVKVARKNHVEVSARSRVKETGNVTITEEVEEAGRLLFNPPPAEFVKLNTVERSPVKKLVSIKGQVVGVSWNIQY